MAERDFKGVWIPKQIWLDNDLGWSEKLLLVEIESLDNEQGCHASNEYLGKFFGLSKDRISKMVSSLKNKGYLNYTVTYKVGTKQIDKRYIKVNKLKFNGIVENNDTYRRKQLEGIGENADRGIGENADRGIGENAEDNNTSFNNTSNNTLNNKNNCSTTSNDEVSKQFETWWNTYGKKLAKPKALASFKRVVKKHGYPKLLEQTMQYVEPFVKGQKDRQYQQHPQTFLNAYDPDNDYTPQKGGYQRNEGFKRADDVDSFKERFGVEAPF